MPPHSNRSRARTTRGRAPAARRRPAAPKRQPRGRTAAPRKTAPAARTRPAGTPKTKKVRAQGGPRRNILWRYRRLIFLVSLLGVFFVAGLAYLLVHAPLPTAEPLGQTTFLMAADGRTRVASLNAGENRELVKLEKVPRVLVDAVLASEDKNFYEHGGLDPVGILRATVNDLRGGGTLQGGSTITQQYVKNIYLTHERTIWRKLKEAALAIKVERKYDKPQILENYLNTIYFGRGAYGVQAASRAYFGKNVDQIGLREASYLAGLIRAPELADPGTSHKVAASRRTRTLDAMVRNGFIRRDEADAVEAVNLRSYVVRKADQEPLVAAKGSGTDYFVDYVSRELQRRYDNVFGGGYRVTTTLDLKTQAQAYDAVYGTLDEPATDPAGALVAINDRGEIKAMVGGRDWEANKVNLAAGKEGGGTGRQAGSTFKPVLLAEVVRQGYTVESSMPGPAKVVLPKANNGKDWEVENFDNEDFGSAVNLIDATRNSVNTVYAQAAVEIGGGNMKEMARDLGVRSDVPAVNALALGTGEVSVLDMAAMFSTFANRGERVDYRAVLKVEDANGKVIEDRTSPKRERVLDREDADVVNFCLRQVVERGTGTGASVPGKSIIGKTGTTQNYGNAWFVGATRKLTAAVWMGFPESNEEMTNVRGRRVNGGSYPAQIFRKFMTQASRGVSAEAFPTPSSFPGKTLKGARVSFQKSASSVPPSTAKPQASTTTAVDDADKPKPTTTEVEEQPPRTMPPRPEPTSPPTTDRPRRTTTTDRFRPDDP